MNHKSSPALTIHRVHVILLQMLLHLFQIPPNNDNNWQLVIIDDNTQLNQINRFLAKPFYKSYLAAAACSLLLWGSRSPYYEGIMVALHVIRLCHSTFCENLTLKMRKHWGTWFQKCGSIGGRQRRGRLEKAEGSTRERHRGGRHWNQNYWEIFIYSLKDIFIYITTGGTEGAV